MSAALAEVVVPVPIQSRIQPSVEKANADPHPLVPVFVFGAIALMGAVLAVGTILALLALRPTGITAPF
ncbi:MAG TPA: hypothetical protein VKW06_01200 [Candidatus Angelobacter sp.]|nr:hypothetical protein [Candidatus Angelobacter sp.]